MNDMSKGLLVQPDFLVSGEIELLHSPYPSDFVALPDMIQAASDIEAAAMWIETQSSNDKSRRVMRKEVERFILWALHTRGKQLSQINVMDVKAYAEFIKDPQPQEIWVSPTKRARKHVDWKPFAGPLSVASQRFALIQIGSMYKWMVQGGRLRGNPVSLMKKPQLLVENSVKRFLPEEGINLAFEVIGNTKNPLKRARDHFMLSLFYLTGLRTFEGTSANMGEIKQAPSGTRWLPVLGKRYKMRNVPISEALYEDLLQYREAFNLPRQILPGDTTPLLLASNSKKSRAHNATVLTSMKGIMKRAAVLAAERGQFELSERLEEATTHWLRHSCFSHLAKETGDLVMIRTLAGHSKIETTSRYMHTEDEALFTGVTTALSTPRPT